MNKNSGNFDAEPKEEALEKSFSKKKKIVIGAVAAVAVVLIVGVGVFAYRSRMSPEEYYQYVEKKNRDETLDTALNYYDSVRSNFIAASEGEAAKKITAKATLSDTAKSLLSLTDLDMSGLETVDLDMQYGIQGSETAYQVNIGANGQPILTTNSYLNEEEGKIYSQVPELTDAWMMESMDDLEMYTGLNVSAGTIASMGSLLPDTSVLSEIVEKYTDMFIESVETVEQSEGTCEAQGVSQETDTYTVTMTEAEAGDFLKEAVAALKTDKNMENLISQIDEEAYQEYVSALEEIQESLAEAETGDETITMKIEVADDDIIVGRTILADNVEIVSACPTDGDAFGMELSFSVDGTKIMTVTGNGTNKSDVINGEFTLGVDGEANDLTELANPDKLLVVSLQDYDISGIEEGKIKGSVTYSTEAVADLANYSLRLEAEGDSDTVNETLSVLAGSEAMVTVDITAEDAADFDINTLKPSDSDTVYDMLNEEEASEYALGVNYTELFVNAANALGIDEEILYGLLLGEELAQ